MHESHFSTKSFFVLNLVQILRVEKLQKKHLLTKKRVFDIRAMVDRIHKLNLSSLYNLQTFFSLGKCVIVLVGATRRPGISC